MFTGLVEKLAEVKSRALEVGGIRISIERPKDWSDLKPGESIAVNGICLTLERFSDDAMEFFLGMETMARTNAQNWVPLELVNLERSLQLGSRLGGHFVSGHIDGTALICESTPLETCHFIKLRVNTENIRYLVPKGSVAIEGVSLTVNSVDYQNCTFEVLLIPTTIQFTNLATRSVGALVNIEFDQLVKTVVEHLKFREVQNAQN
ncbi:MAG: riboflavin synthase [Oligoflexia bacterium]|nr:riboflavin synthase [Oligoflexia bacterium]